MNETEPSSSEPPSSSVDARAGDDDTPPRQPGSDTDLHDDRGDAAGGLSIDLVDRAGLLDGALRARLESQVRAALDAARAGGEPLRGEVRLEIVSDEAMARAHVEYLDIEGTTDVLTFDLTGGASAPVPDGSDEGADGGAGEPLDVDIMICVDVARRRAHELGHPVESEMTLYAVHGVLHCLGYDDIDEEGAARMHAEEDRLLGAAGLGAVFAAADAGTNPTDGDAS